MDPSPVAATTSILEIYKQLTAAGVPFGLFALLVLIYKRVLWFGSTVEPMLAEKDKQIASEREQKEEFKRMLFSTRALANRAVSVADKALGS
jgi:hypothetical protein